MKKFFIKVNCLILNSLYVTLAFLFLVIWDSFWTVIMFIITICGGMSWHSLKLRLTTLWTTAAEGISETITVLQKFDKENYGI
jgi:hypothetical protein